MQQQASFLAKDEPNQVAEGELDSDLVSASLPPGAYLRAHVLPCQRMYVDARCSAFGVWWI